MEEGEEGFERKKWPSFVAEGGSNGFDCCKEEHSKECSCYAAAAADVVAAAVVDME